MKINKILYVFLGLILIPIVSAQTFGDVPTTHTNYAAIEALVSKGIINGYPDGTFKPENPINRVETLKIILLSVETAIEETTYNAGFPDIVSNSWYSKYVVKAKNDGIVKGNPDGYFYPNNQVNFAEALKMIALAQKVELPKEIISPPFLDVPISSWFTPYFTYAKEHNIIQKTSTEDVFPAKALTRAEVAELVFRFQEVQKSEISTVTQLASYYADEFQGRNTASGEIFDQEKLTAAHKTLPFGTKVKVTNLENNQSVIVTINDRGPYADNPSYVLDLSKSAFQSIAPLTRGIIKINYSVVTDETDVTAQNKVFEANPLCNLTRDKDKIAVDFYQFLTLEKELPTIFLKNESFLVKGRILPDETDTKIVTVFLVNQNGYEKRFSGEVKNFQFEIPVLFQTSGVFNLGILAGDSGKTYINEIEVLPEECSQTITEQAVEPDNLKVEVEQNQTFLSWDNKGQSLSKIEIWQGENKNTYITNNKVGKFQIPFPDFLNFSTGQVYYRVSSAKSSSDFSIDRNSEWTASKQNLFMAVNHHQVFNDLSKIEVSTLPNDYGLGQTIKISGKTKVNLDFKASIILPTGLIQNVDLSSEITSTNALNKKIIPAGNNFYFNYKPEISGTHILEINSDDGFAVINLPVYQQGFAPLIPDIWDKNPSFSTEVVDFNLAESTENLLKMLNQSRENYGFKSVVRDSKLNQLAQDRAADMAQNNYFSHQNLDGKYAYELKVDYDIKANVSENIAKDVSLVFAHEGLMRSAIHRANILNGSWTRVGIGIAQTRDGYLIITEIFSEEELSATALPQMRSQVLENINQNRTQKELLSDSILDNIAQDWSGRIINKNYWFDIPETGISLSYLITQKVSDKQTASTILKGDFKAILDKISTNETLLNTRWSKLGVGITQNDLGTLNITLIYSE